MRTLLEFDLDAWIITNGHKEESITELIGEVVYDSQMKSSAVNFNAIAVGKWGNIHDCHKLKDGFERIEYQTNEVCSYFRNDQNDRTVLEGHGKYKLELNHTQYIFFDDGTCDSLDTDEFASNLALEVSFRAKRRSQCFVSSYSLQ
jgi:hypothetical protein